jgi:cell wall-associated NlpC family hydrolase
VTAPTPAVLALARSSLPTRRVSAAVAPASRGQFASVLRQASLSLSGPATPQVTRKPVSVSSALPFSAPTLTHAAFQPVTSPGTAPISRGEILARAQSLMDVPYVWGGNSSSGLDCSAFVSQVWGVSRHTTDTLNQVATPISKEQLQPGDALNLTTSADSRGIGHVRLFEKWADAAHTKMWVYEETPPRSVHHVINWDPKYTPMRRVGVTDSL